MLSFLYLAYCLAPHAPAEDNFEASRLEKQIVVAACHDPMQMEVLSDGRLLFIERGGKVKLVPDATQQSLPVTIGEIPVAVFGEVGLLGIAADKRFFESGYIYLLFCPQEKPDTIRLGRFSIVEDRLETNSEKVLLEYPIDKAGAIHMGGGLWIDSSGDLWIGTGDNSPPIPELPVDIRPGREVYDALRSSANTQDLRGKILRIHPESDGGYSIPNGNLFTDPRLGREEIFAMGCRNPFRISVDEETGAVLWGDVGPNIDQALDIGPNGYDEFHRATKAGNFGWPMFVADNQAYRNFDFLTRQPGELFDVFAPLNNSPNNTGTRALPRPKPAVIWYPSTKSELFPTLGSGGRSAMSGPVYRHKSLTATGLHLHERFQGRWFIFDWTRNWIQTASLNDDGSIDSIEPFMPNAQFRKPIDIKVGPDGTLYVIEFGDKWGGNRDAQIARILYRRGNRAPTARISAPRLAGKSPLKLSVDGSESTDPDGDTLSYQWLLNDKPLETANEQVELNIEEPGSHTLRLLVRDQANASGAAEVELYVGNSSPKVKFTSPKHGSFFDWGETIHYSIEVNDLEDGSTSTGGIPAARVLTSSRLLTRRNQSRVLDPGLALMRKTTCFSCHTTKAASAGPAYEVVARKYRGASDEIRRKLAAKIVTGGAGVWGNKPMPAHPQHSLEEAQQMVQWVLSLNTDVGGAPQPGDHGFIQTEWPTDSEPSALLLTAEYTDNGAEVEKTSSDEEFQKPNRYKESIPALRDEQHLILHARRKRAAFADCFQQARPVDVFEGGIGLVARLSLHGWIAFDDLRLEEIDRISLQVNYRGPRPGRLVLHENGPRGPELGACRLTPMPDEGTLTLRSFTIPIQAKSGLTSLFVELDVDDTDGEEDTFSSEDFGLDIAWIEFHESVQAKQKRLRARENVKRILLIPTELDHAWATHMYTDVCRLLAATLNLTPGVEAIVSPNLDWPSDENLLKDIDGIVYYSRPAGDILLSPAHQAETQQLMKRGVGFTAIHWSTGAEENVGKAYESILGGWFNFAFSGLMVDKKNLSQLDPTHPICRGWDEYLIRDEFYLNLRFHPKTIPLLKVRVDDQDQTVAWVYHREGGGRSFGTTLGHFHDNFADPRFRKMLANGILWTVGMEIPEAGLPVDISGSLLELEQPSTSERKSRDWSYDQLRNTVLNLQRTVGNQPSFRNGQRLFDQAACSACHAISGGIKTANLSGNSADTLKLGPDLSDVRIRYAVEEDPPGAILRSILEPSLKIDEKYRNEILVLDDGTVITGLVQRQEGDRLMIADNPQNPAQVRDIPLESIETRRTTDVSSMPTGLLNNLTAEEVFDLLTYVEAGGNPRYFAYQQPTKTLEAWADSDLPIMAGLRQWLDASKMNSGRRALELPQLGDGSPVGLWPDASGSDLNALQRQAVSQPIFRESKKGNWVEFDGTDDFLIATSSNYKTLGFTAMIVVAPNHNRNWPGILSANAIGRNDYQSGFNIDLMFEPTQSWQTIMSEGPGYQGITNLMVEDHPWGKFQIVTLRSEPGKEGVTLRINGRKQRSRQRPEKWILIDEMTVGARYWSNDSSIPPYNRGFLSGRIAQVLFYDRPLSDEEMVANEVYLWNANESLLDPNLSDGKAASKHD